MQQLSHAAMPAVQAPVHPRVSVPLDSSPFQNPGTVLRCLPLPSVLAPPQLLPAAHHPAWRCMLLAACGLQLWSLSFFQNHTTQPSTALALLPVAAHCGPLASFRSRSPSLMLHALCCPRPLTLSSWPWTTQHSARSAVTVRMATCTTSKVWLCARYQISCLGLAFTNSMGCLDALQFQCLDAL